MLRFKLRGFLHQHNLTVAELAEAIAEELIESREGVSERHLRNIVYNTEPLTEDNRQKKPSFEMLGFIISGLRRLTDQEVEVGDVLEYLSIGVYRVLPRTPTSTSDTAEGTATNDSSGPGSTSSLVLPEDDGGGEAFDEIADLVVHSLINRGYSDLGAEVAALMSEESPPWDSQASARGVSRKVWPFVSTILLLVAVGYLAYEQFVLRPRLLSAYSMFAFRDRIRPTSELPTPTLIGPEGEVNSLMPTLRVSDVADAFYYEFYVEDEVSDEGVYTGTGPISSAAFPIPENTLCPNTSYSWRARALGEDGWTSFSSPLRFTVSPEALDTSQEDLLRLTTIHEKPQVPELVAPIGTVNTTTPVLEVSADDDAYGYGFYIRDLGSDKLVYLNHFATENSVTLPPDLLEHGGVYQWNARSRNCHYWSEFTPTQIFTVDASD